MRVTEDTISGGVAVITGAAAGIGLGIARAAAARGMKLVLADIAADRLAAVSEEFAAAGHEVLAVPTDVTDQAALERLAEATYARFGAVTLLVNNAGIGILGRIWEIPAAQWEQALRINILGPVHGVRAFAPAMIEADQPAFIANIASIGAFVIASKQSPYLMSKHAILSFSECLWLEMSEVAPKICVSAVLPGPVRTRIFRDAASGKESEADAGYRDVMDTVLVDHGMDADQAGLTIFNQIIEGRFWIGTDNPMLAAAAKRRGTYISNMASPRDRGSFT